MSGTEGWALLSSATIFVVGLGGVLLRKNAIVMLIGIELMLNAANLNLIVFSRRAEEAAAGWVFVLFSIGVAAAEVAVGLALIIAVYRRHGTIRLDEVDLAERLKG